MRQVKGVEPHVTAQVVEEGPSVTLHIGRDPNDPRLVKKVVKVYTATPNEVLYNPKVNLRRQT